jgi:hypothetical protein
VEEGKGRAGFTILIPNSHLNKKIRIRILRYIRRGCMRGPCNNELNMELYTQTRKSIKIQIREKLDICY